MKAIATPEPDRPGLERYLIRDRVEILAILRLLERTATTMCVHPGRGDEFFLSSVQAVVPEQNELRIEDAPVAQLARLAQRSSENLLVGICERVKIQFEVGPWRAMQDQGTPLLVSQLPTTLLRLQRREYYRVEVPSTTPLRCRIPPQPPHTQTETLARIVDISGGGIALVEADSGNGFPAGLQLSGCRIELPGAIDVKVDLMVRSCQPASGRPGQTRWTSGCEFVNLPEPVRAQMQRTISRLEREQVKLAKRS